MGVESNARVHFGWNNPPYNLEGNDYNGLYDSPAVYWKQVDENWRELVVSDDYAFHNKKSGLPVLGIHQIWAWDDWNVIIAHKGFQRRVRSIEIAPLELPDAATIETMSEELKRDAKQLGLDLELLGEPAFLLSAGETWQGEVEGD